MMPNSAAFMQSIHSATSPDSISTLPSQGLQLGLMFFSSGEESLGLDKYRLVLESAKFADQHGFSSIWVPERHFTPFGCLYPNPAILQAALARETQHIRLQAGSVVLPLNDPMRVAEAWAMVDNLSGGRVGVSFAPGWNPEDFALAPQQYTNRHQIMFEEIQTVQKLWRGDFVQRTGGKGQSVSVRMYPTPVQSELPIWVTAASSPQTFMQAGAIGANLLTHLFDQTVEALAEKLLLYRQARSQHGYNPDEGQITVALHTFVGENMEVVRSKVRDPYCAYLKAHSQLLAGLSYSRGHTVNVADLSAQDLDDFTKLVFEKFFDDHRAFLGTPESCLGLAQQLQQIGVSEVACLLDFGPDVDLILQNLTHLNQLRDACEGLTSAPSPDSLAPESRIQNDNSLKSPPSVSDHLSLEKAISNGSSLDRSISAIQDRCFHTLTGDAFYQQLQTQGVNLDRSFQGIEHLWYREGEALGKVRLPESIRTESSYEIHPAFLDACLNVFCASLPMVTADVDSTSAQRYYFPVGLGEFQSYGPLGDRVWSHAKLTSSSVAAAPFYEGKVQVLDLDGQLLMDVKGLRVQQAFAPEEAVPENAAERGDGVTQPVMPDLANWFYQVEWQQQPYPKANTSPSLSDNLPFPEASRKQQLGHHWLVFADHTGVATALAIHLQQQGDQATLVYAGDSHSSSDQTSDTHTWQLEALDHPQALQRLCEQLKEDVDAYRGIIYLWGLDVLPADLTSANLEAALPLVAHVPLQLVQALEACSELATSPIWWVTRGSQPVMPAETLAIAPSLLWGLGNVLAVEQPQRRGGLIDLDPGTTDQQAATDVLAAIQAPESEDSWAFRNGNCYGPRLVTQEPPADAPLSLAAAHGSYLITGGLGDLGLLVAQWLADQGAQHLILLGRSPLPPRPTWSAPLEDSRVVRQVTAVQALEAQGVHIYLATADVSEQEQMERALSQAHREGCPPVRGVLHLAAVPQPLLPLAQLDTATLNTVLRPKVLGSWVLHQIFARDSLDFFVLFSSWASLLGSVGQQLGSYSMANTFLDTLAHHRHSLGQSALSINWGDWAEVGMRARYVQAGYQLLPDRWTLQPEAGLRSLATLLPSTVGQVGVLPVPWTEFFQLFPHTKHHPFLTEIATTVKATSRQTAAAAQWLQTLETLPADVRRSRLTDHVQTQVAEIMGLSSLSEFDHHRGLFELGMDSLMALELKNRLEISLGQAIPAVVAFEHPSVSALSTYLAETILGWTRLETPTATVPTPAVSDDPITAISQMSEAEVEQLLAEKISR